MSNIDKSCFVVMPISDMPGYEPGHFSRVYEYIIKPACMAAGLEPIRADEVKGTNYIAIDILQRILQSKLVVCDLSGRNANVMYELGVRQAFDLPVVLLKDHRTERVFDIQGLRTLDYHENLRVDTVQQDQGALQKAIQATLSLNSQDVNSLVRLLGIEKATIGERTEVSPDTALVLASLKDISQRLGVLEESTSAPSTPPPRMSRASLGLDLSTLRTKLPNGETIDIGSEIYEEASGKHTSLGELVARTRDGFQIRTPTGKLQIIRQDDALAKRLTAIPF
jgi:hypothetical protein